MSLEEKDTNDLDYEPKNQEDKETLDGWEKKYKEKYPIVGTVIVSHVSIFDGAMCIYELIQESTCKLNTHKISENLDLFYVKWLASIEPLLIQLKEHLSDKS